MNKSIKMRADNEYINWVMQQKWSRYFPFKMNDEARNTLRYNWIAFGLEYFRIIELSSILEENNKRKDK